MCAAGLLLAALLVAAPTRASSGATGECRATVGGLRLQTVTIKQLGSALRSGKVTSRALVSAYLARIKAYDTVLNSIRVLNPRAMAEAAEIDAELRKGEIRGPLAGIPILLKDNVNTTDMPTTAGSLALEGSVPLHEATITTKLKDAGAIILGKTNLSEFANWVDLSMPNGYSSLGGQVRNAHHFGDPSGSSSGSGVAGSMAFSAGTVGTETSGSILSPSHANGLVGIKPTTGLLSRYGILPLAPSFDTPGPMVRNVTDAAIMLTVMAGPDEKDPRTAESDGMTPPGLDYTRFLKRGGLEGVRLGFSPGDRGALFDQALTVLEDLGATLVETDTLNNASLAGLTEIAAIPNEFKASLNQYLLDETVDSLRVRTLSDIVAFNEQHPEEVKYGQGLLQASDGTPGVMEAGIPNKEVTIRSSQLVIDGALMADDLDAFVAAGPTFANISAAAGYPTVIVPAGNVSNRPQGLSFLGTAYSEPQLISYAYDYEQASHLRVPPTELNVNLFAKRCG